MSQITNDNDMRAAIHSLQAPQRALLAARLVQAVEKYTSNPGLLDAIKVALKGEAAEGMRDYAYRTAKTISTDTYTACGRDADWLAQAEHFVAAACVAALSPLEEFADDKHTWKAAMQARMAHTCAMIENPDPETDNEATRQYDLVRDLLN